MESRFCTRMYLINLNKYIFTSSIEIIKSTQEREKYEKKKFFYCEENNSSNVIVYDFIVRA